MALCLVFLVAAMAGCLPPPRSGAISVDGGEQAAFAGRTFVGVNSDLFTIDRAALHPIGTGTTNLVHADGRVYSLAGVDEQRVVVMFDAQRAVLFVESAFLMGLPSAGPQGDPLAVALPAICVYWNAPKPSTCTSRPSSPAHT